MRDSKLFDEAVEKFFRPIAQKLHLSLARIQEGIYDMPSRFFILRIRLDTGHARGLNVILRPASWPDIDENDPKTPQLGIVCFAQFYGEQIQQTLIKVYTDEDFLNRTKLLVEAVERFGVPYLLGQKDDFEAVREFIKKRGEPELQKIKEIQRIIEHNMPSVRQEWIIPEDEMPQ